MSYIALFLFFSPVVKDQGKRSHHYQEPGGCFDSFHLLSLLERERGGWPSETHCISKGSAGEGIAFPQYGILQEDVFYGQFLQDSDFSLIETH